VKWWRRFNLDDGGFEKYSTDDIQAIGLGVSIFVGFISLMVWL
jgi:hypothetical protein